MAGTENSKTNSKLCDVVERIPGKESRELGSNPHVTTIWFRIFI